MSRSTFKVAVTDTQDRSADPQTIALQNHLPHLRDRSVSSAVRRCIFPIRNSQAVDRMEVGCPSFDVIEFDGLKSRSHDEGADER